VRMGGGWTWPKIVFSNGYGISGGEPSGSAATLLIS
jgi:hypothetical protein